MAAVQAVATAVILSLKWLVFAYLLWALASTLGLVALRADEIRSTADLRPAIGLNLCCDNLPPMMDTTLNQFNLFEIWYIVLLAIGLRTAFRASAQASAALAAGIWFFAFIVQLAFGYAARIRIG